MSPKKRQNNRKIIGYSLAGVGILFLIVCGAMAVYAPKIYSYLRSRSPVSIGSRAPDFELTALTGESVRLSQYRGRPMLLSFGATWCPDCARADPLLQETFDHQTGLVVLLVDSGETTATIQKWADETGYTFPVLIDSNNAAGKQYAITAIPTVFFIDEDGVIRAKLIETVTAELLEGNLPLIGIEP